MSRTCIGMLAVLQTSCCSWGALDIPYFLIPMSSTAMFGHGFVNICLVLIFRFSQKFNLKYAFGAPGRFGDAPGGARGFRGGQTWGPEMVSQDGVQRWESEMGVRDGFWRMYHKNETSPKPSLDPISGTPNLDLIWRAWAASTAWEAWVVPRAWKAVLGSSLFPINNISIVSQS